MNQSSTNFGIAFKLGGLGDGPLLSCMNYVGLELAIIIVLTLNKFSLGKGFQKNAVKKFQNMVPP